MNGPTNYRYFYMDIFDEVCTKSRTIASIAAQQQILRDQYKQLKDYANQNQIQYFWRYAPVSDYDSV
jgi:hypothetical protein